MRTIKLTLSYDGTNYVGWQRQPRGQSIQGVLEGALEGLSGESVSVVAAGRTDAGVHAIGQIAHFVTRCRIPCDGIKKGLNSILSPDIVVTNASQAVDGFHARKGARGKLYRYRLSISGVRAPLLLNRCWQIRGPLDLSAMRKAASHLIGEHDFSSFRASGCRSKDAVRKIRRIRFRRHKLDEGVGDGAGLLDIEFEGNGFVRHMIRNIVGTLIEVGRGRIKPKEVSRILKARKREAACRCAPACGLYLIRVFY